MRYDPAASVCCVLKHPRGVAMTALLLLCAPIVEPVMAQHRVAFVTSISGDSDLGAWPVDGITGTGLVAADEICTTLAEQTGSATGSVEVSGSGLEDRTVTITAISGAGTLGISIAADTASDTAGNGAAATGPSTTFIVHGSETIFEDSFE